MSRSKKSRLLILGKLKSVARMLVCFTGAIRNRENIAKGGDEMVRIYGV
jgi:hypothetical protein